MLLSRINFYLRYEWIALAKQWGKFFIYSAYNLTFQVHGCVDDFWSNDFDYLKSKCDYHCYYLFYMLDFVIRDSFLGYIDLIIYMSQLIVMLTR
jgi:hypothetical protein